MVDRDLALSERSAESSPPAATSAGSVTATCRAILRLRLRSQRSNLAGWLLRWDQITHTEPSGCKSSAEAIISYVTLAVISLKGEAWRVREGTSPILRATYGPP
jgi:hypothetical protein